MLVLVKEVFVAGRGIIIQLAFGGFRVDLPGVGFDGVLEVVDVDELDVELIVQVVYFKEVFFGCLPCGNINEPLFKLAELVAPGTQCLPPGIAFS
jgi:hypothetical protein